MSGDEMSSQEEAQRLVNNLIIERLMINKRLREIDTELADLQKKYNLTLSSVDLEC